MKRLLAIAIIALAGCSITSQSPPENMQCMLAHDEYSGGARHIICDEYRPKDEATR